VFEFVQEKVAPGGVLANGRGFIVSPGQTEIAVILFTCGVGFIEMVNCVETPWHPFKEGITMMFAVILLPVKLFEAM
jgi:hypothetical protein